MILILQCEKHVFLYNQALNFHYLFFDNDLFLLDPNTSIMINMFPSAFFMHMVFMIIAAFALCAGLVYTGACLLERRKA